MTRVNIGIAPAELCNQHLIAEYRELPRIFGADPAGAPALPCLGRGHVKWCAAHQATMAERFADLIEEMRHRGFRVAYASPPEELPADRQWTNEEVEAVGSVAAQIRQRIYDRLLSMRRQPTWTRRVPPPWAMRALQARGASS